MRLSRVCSTRNRCEVEANFQTPSRSSVAATKLGELFLIAGETDRATERERLDKEDSETGSGIKSNGSKAGECVLYRARPKQVVEEHQRRRADFSARLAQLRKARASLD